MNERIFRSESSNPTSEFTDVVREILPEGVKNVLRPIFGKEVQVFPLRDPVFVDVGGIEAKFYIRNKSDWIRLRASNYGEPYEADLIGTIKEQENPVFVDVGSAQGVYTIPAALIGAEVFSIDPDPVSSESLRENIVINPEIEGEIDMIPLALGNERSEVEFHIDNKGRSAPSLEKTVRELRDIIRVEMVPFDDLVSEGKVKIPTVVKIDVEGAEELVIRGMEETLKCNEAPSDLFVELHPEFLKKFGSNLNDVKKTLKNLGYRLEEDKYWPRGQEIHCHFEK